MSRGGAGGGSQVCFGRGSMASCVSGGSPVGVMIRAVY